MTHQFTRLEIPLQEVSRQTDNDEGLRRRITVSRAASRSYYNAADRFRQAISRAIQVNRTGTARRQPRRRPHRYIRLRRRTVRDGHRAEGLHGINSRQPGSVDPERERSFASEPGKNALKLGSVEGGPGRVLLPVNSSAVYVAGHLLYVNEGALLAHRFDAAK